MLPASNSPTSFQPRFSSMSSIQNPILRGFNPDPSIVRVDDDYYIATSTFEWHPGVRLHHSRDLAHWKVVGHALDGGFNLQGVPDSGGVWAPSLSYSNGQFWLAYSVVRTMDGDDLDVENYLIKSTSIEGPWTAPVFLGSRGFDFSFFHDADGSHWLVGVQWDQRPDEPSFSGIVLEQYLDDENRVSGIASRIYSQPDLVEGPNLYQIDGWYYLLLAEGGTGWNHGITLARSRDRLGPYERDSEPAVLTSRDAPGIELQKAGHGELVRTSAGDWMLVHLASRPVLAGGERYSILGRETCLQQVHFTSEGWLRLAPHGHHPVVDLSVPLDVVHVGPVADRDDFDDALDSRVWSTLRSHLSDETADTSSRPGWLRLRGGASAGSVFTQSMIAQRIPEHHLIATTLVDASPTSARHAAGILVWYDRVGYAWLQLTWDQQHGRHLRVQFRDSTTTRSLAVPSPEGPVRMKLKLAGSRLQFWAAPVHGEWIPVGDSVDAWRLSDDHGGHLRFTGLMVGLRSEDLDASGWYADFDYFSIRSDVSS